MRFLAKLLFLIIFVSSSAYAISYDAGGGGGSGTGESFNNISETGSTVTITGTLSIGGASQIVSTNTATRFYNSTSTLTFEISSNTWNPKFQYVVTSTACSSTAGACQMPGVGWPVLAGSTYYAEFDGFYVTASTLTSLSFGFTGPTGSTVSYHGWSPINTTSPGNDNFGERACTALDCYIIIANSLTNAINPLFNTFSMRGFFVMGNAGTLAPIFQPENNGVSVTVNRGSVLRIWEVPTQ